MADEGLLVYAPLLEGVKYPFKFFNFLNGKAFITNEYVEFQEVSPNN